MTDEATVRRLYAGFNRRDIPAVLALLAEDVAWADGQHGGHVHGHDAVRAYWTAQWAAIQPRVEPVWLTEFRRRGSSWRFRTAESELIMRVS